MVVFYVMLAAVTAAVVIVVIHKGHNEKAQPVIAGGYTATSAAACIGPVPKPAGGIPLPATAPAQAAAAGPAFNLVQSGQYVSVTNNQNTLGGQLRMYPQTLAGGARRLSGTIDCLAGPSEHLNATITPGPTAAIAGTLGGHEFGAALKRSPPDPGAAAPRTPTGVGGMYTTTPRSTCLGGTYNLHGSGPYTLVAYGKTLGTVTYSSKTGAVFGDVACLRGGHARLTAVANDLQLQTMQVIPLDVATPTPTTASLPKPVLTTPSGLGPAGETFTSTKQRSDFNKLVAAFFLSVLIVLVIARLFGIVATKVGQPSVMGEVIAGICLGPSVLGQISPNLQAAMFPTDILPAIGVAANLGLVFYMFLVGLEIDRDQLKGRAVQATAISNASVAIPMLLGIAVALPLYKLVGPDKKFVAFALFMGVAMSITAFPVLARILAERRMLRSPLGALTISCAAIDDVTAWFLIALATTVAASGTFGDVAKTIGEAAAFTLVMWFVVRRVLARMSQAFDEVGRIPTLWLAAIFIGVLLSAYITEEINIAFIFGGFIMGMVMPRNARMTEEITRRIEDFVLMLLLPLFFVYTGLKLNITLLDRPALWLITLLLIAVAIVGKLAGATIAARVSGYSLRESAVIGTLMNTRGLTELIVLNLALTAGAISSALFAALVIMAVVTTLMTGPLLRLLDPQNVYGRRVEDDFAAATEADLAARPIVGAPARSILIAPQTDGAMAQLVAIGEPLARSEPHRELLITRLVQPSRAVDAGVRVGLQTESLQLQIASEAINKTRARLSAAGIANRGVALASQRPGADLAEIVEKEPVDLVVIEGRRRLIGDGVPLGEVSVLLERAPCDVAVLIAREDAQIELGPARPVLVPFGGAEHDWAALESDRGWPRPSERR